MGVDFVRRRHVFRQWDSLRDGRNLPARLTLDDEFCCRDRRCISRYLSSNVVTP